jgi:hypothetical protein
MFRVIAVRLLAGVALWIAAAPATAQGTFGGAEPPKPDTQAADTATHHERARSISVSLATPREKATDRVVLVLSDMGYAIEHADAYVVSTSPGGAKDWRFVANVALSATGDSTRAIITGRFYNPLVPALRRAVAGGTGAPDDLAAGTLPVEEHEHGVQGMLWKRIQDIAARLSTQH